MSILIKGMEMPKNCGECPCCENTFYQCNINGARFFKVRDAYEKRHPDCPLIELPPHGRLIDADALAGRLGITDMDCYKCAWGNHGFCSRGGDFTDACEAIEDAPTIIEAEE